MSKQKKQTSSRGRTKPDIVLDTALTLDYEGKPTPGPDISTFPIPMNFSVLNLDLENPADLLQNMKDCIGLHRFWTYVNTDKRYRSPQGSMSWKVPKSGTYYQYLKYRDNWICLVEIASQSWFKGVITKKGVAEFQDSENDETATYIRTILQKIILNSKGNYKQDVHETKLGPRWLKQSFDSVLNRITGDGDCGDLDEAFTVIVVHFWDAVRNDEVKDLVLASFDPSLFATRYLGLRPVGLMKKWKRCCKRAIRCIENKEPYQIQRDTNPTSASELLQVVRVLYRDDHDVTPINDDSMPIKLNGVDELRHGSQEEEHPAPDGGGQASGSNPPTPKYPDWILDSFSEPNEQQQHGQGQISYAWASKMGATASTKDICDTRDENQSCSTGGFFTVEKTENTNPRRIERFQPLLLNGHLEEVVLNSRGYDGYFTIDGSSEESIAWRAKSWVRRGFHMAFSFMKKSPDMQNIDMKGLTLSDITLDHVRGFTLVEADKSCDIAKASKYIDLYRDTNVNIKDITADNRPKKLLTKLRPKVYHQAISKEVGGTTSLKEIEVAAPLLIKSQDIEFLEVHCEVMHDNQIGDIAKMLDGKVFNDGIMCKRAKLSSVPYWWIQLTETSPSNKSSANDIGWVFTIYGSKGRTVRTDQDMKASSLRETCSNIKAKRGDKSSVLYLVLLEVKMYHSLDKNKRVTARQSRWYSLHLQVLNIIVKDGTPRLNNVTVAPVESWKMQHLAKTDMVAAGAENTRVVATESGRTMMRRRPFIQDGWSCWSEVADHGASTKGSIEEEAFSQGELSWGSGGYEPSGGDDQAGRKDGNGECGQPGSDANPSTMLALSPGKGKTGAGSRLHEDEHEPWVCPWRVHEVDQKLLILIK